MYLLDTNVLSELRKAGASRADKNVLAWATAIPAAELYISSISVLEIEMGVLKLERKDPHQASVYRTWLNEHVLTAFSRRVIPFDCAAALKCAQLHVPNPKSERDAMIAASAIVHGMTLVSRNERDFRHIDVRLINPWLS